MKFDPESYTITIRKEEEDGEILYVGRVAEFPNISAYEDTFEAARELVLDSVQTLKAIADEAHAEFPLPYPAPSDEFSGRVTLRLPKSLHAKAARMAAQEDISFNLYLVTAIASYAGEADGISKVVSKAVDFLGHIITDAMSTMHVWKHATFIFNSATPSMVAIPSVLPLGQKFITYQTPQSIGVTHHG